MKRVFLLFIIMSLVFASNSCEKNYYRPDTEVKSTLKTVSKDINIPSITSSSEKVLSKSVITPTTTSRSTSTNPQVSAVVPTKAIKPTITKTPDDVKIFTKLTNTFIFTSGAGAWSTEVQINPDGTFTGNFQDSNMGDTGANYPNGTRYECRFNGKFTVVEKISYYEYTMKIDYLKTEGIVDEEKIIDGVKVITSTPYGFDNANEFFLYLPGRITKDLPKEFMEWVSMPNPDWLSEANGVIPFYGLYNVGGKQGFFSE